MTQARYEEITYGFTLAAARSLVKRTPNTARPPGRGFRRPC
jgi:hypothetical protein